MPCAKVLNLQGRGGRLWEEKVRWFYWALPLVSPLLYSTSFLCFPTAMVAPGAKYYFNTYSAGVPSEPSQAGNVMSTECGPLVGQRETTYFTTIQRAMEIAIVRSC